MYTSSLTIFIKLDLQNYKRSMLNLFYEHQNLAFSFFHNYIGIERNILLYLSFIEQTSKQAIRHTI